MSTFRDAMGANDAEDEPKNLPAVPAPAEPAEPADVSDADIVEDDAPPVLGAGPVADSRADFSEVDDADYGDLPRPGDSGGGSDGSKRQLLLGAFIALAILGLVAAVALGGGEREEPTPTETKPAATAPAKAKPAKPKETPPVQKTTPEPVVTSPDEDAEIRRRIGKVNDDIGLPTAAEKAAARRLLRRARIMIQSHDHARAIDRDSERFARHLSRPDHLNMKVITRGKPAPGQLRITSAPRVGFVLVMTTAGKGRFPEFETVKVRATGIPGVPRAK